MKIDFLRFAFVNIHSPATILIILLLYVLPLVVFPYSTQSWYHSCLSNPAHYQKYYRMQFHTNNLFSQYIYHSRFGGTSRVRRLAESQHPSWKLKSFEETIGETLNLSAKSRENQTKSQKLPEKLSSDTGNSLKRNGRSSQGVQQSRKGQIQARLRETRKNLASGGELTQELCDSLLAEGVATDEWELVLDVLDLMTQKGLRQVRSSYKACLQACLDASNAASSNEMLSAMGQAQVVPDPNDIGLTVLTMCRKEQTEKGWWRQAFNLVKQYDDLPISAYDTVLTCMANERQWQDAVRLLRTMEDQAMKPTESTKEQAIDESKGVKTLPAISTYRIVIECCVRCDQSEVGVQVLQSCVRRGLTPTMYTFELVITALSKRLQWRRSLQLLELMEQLKVPKSVQIYNAVITACAKARENVQAKNLLLQMRKNKMRPTIISYNSVISACASSNDWKDALSVLDLALREPGVTPDVYTYTNAIRACAKGGQTTRALTLFQVVKDKKLPLDAYFYTAVIDACSKGGMWEKALDLLNEMEEKSIKPSEVTFSVAITACGNGGQWQKALDLLSLMRKREITINLYVYNAAITALSKAAKRKAKTNEDPNRQLYQEVLKLLKQMREDGIEPDGFSFSSAISCCGSEGRWEEALNLIELMQQGGPRTQPNKVAYTAAITSCGRSGQADKAIQLFRQMKEQGLQADRVAYNALFSALRVAKRPDAAFDLWHEMLGTKKISTDKIAAAGRYQSTTPDIITVTDGIAAMSSGSDDVETREKVDKVFAEAVRRNIVLRDINNLESNGEIDLSGMSFPVARAACRYVLRRLLSNSSKVGKSDGRDLIFITGVGASHDKSTSSLKEYIQEVLLTDFIPSIDSFVPEQGQSKVNVKDATVTSWIVKQRR